MKVSILIGTRDRIELLSRCLHNILSQDYPATKLEILVLDDNSSQYRLKELLAEKFKDDRLRCFRTEQSLGVAGGRNFLMAQAQGDIFCFIDDDAYFADERGLAQFVALFETWPKIGIVAPKIIDHQPDHDHLFVPFNKQWRKKQPDLIDKAQYVSYYVGTCHAIRQTVISQCGGYQHDLVYGEEELDLSYRAIEAGFEIFYQPKLLVHHYPAPSVVKQQGRQQHPELYYHVRNRFFIAYKYLPWLYIPIYLTIWLSIYGRDALKVHAFREFFSGIIAGIKLWGQIKRTVLSSLSVHYLKNHYGRLWY